jgi:hypothetical protein
MRILLRDKLAITFILAIIAKMVIIASNLSRNDDYENIGSLRS